MENNLERFIYIDDIINAIIESLKTDRTIGQIYNLGSGKKNNIKNHIKNI